MVNLRVYNIAGQAVRTLVHEEKKMGRYEVAWNGKDEGGQRVSAGLYFYKLDAAGVSEVKRLVLIK